MAVVHPPIRSRRVNPFPAIQEAPLGARNPRWGQGGTGLGGLGEETSFIYTARYEKTEQKKKNRGQKLGEKKQNTGAPKKADHHRAGGPHNHVPRAPPAMSPRVISINNNATLCTFCSGISLRGLGLIASKRGDHYFRVFPFAWLSSLLDARGASKAQPYQRQREMHAGTQTSDEQHYAYELLRLKNDEECRISAC